MQKNTYETKFVVRLFFMTERTKRIVDLLKTDFLDLAVECLDNYDVALRPVAEELNFAYMLFAVNTKTEKVVHERTRNPK